MTVFGRGFLNYADPAFPPRCRLGVGVSPAVVMSDSMLVCEKVDDTVFSGFATVSIALNGQDFTDSVEGGTVEWVYYNHPTLRDAFPDTGPMSGGTKVRVTGRGFIMMVSPPSPL